MSVEHLLAERVPDLGQVDVRFFGAKEPLVRRHRTFPSRKTGARK